MPANHPDSPAPPTEIGASRTQDETAGRRPDLTRALARLLLALADDAEQGRIKLPKGYGAGGTTDLSTNAKPRGWRSRGKAQS
jgi:hypothetical protein